MREEGRRATQAVVVLWRRECEVTGALEVLARVPVTGDVTRNDNRNKLTHD